MRASALFMPTVREDPADAEAVSHKLMVRGGFVRQFASGIYIMLPLGWRVMQRICRIIREEMEAIGALEVSMPTLHPAEVWQATGRYEAIGQEMFRLKDRGGRDMVLAMTHEEVFAWLAAKELRSYRDLPQIWYQIQLKFRDEPRPKGGVLRVREFLMKDSYSFDLDEAGLEESYQKHIRAYDRIFSRCGIAFYRVESDTGFMGGAQAHEYIAPSEAGEDRIVLCASCGYAANVEMARSVPSPRVGFDMADLVSRQEALGRLVPDGAGCVSRSMSTARGPAEPVAVATPDMRSIEQVCGYLDVAPAAVIKALVYMAGDQPVMALLRGDHDLQENKLARFMKSPVRPAHPEEVKAFTGTEVGFVGPVGLPADAGVVVVADEVLRPCGPAGGSEGEWFVAGANQAHTHLVGVVPEQHFHAHYADLRQASEGDGCPQCGGRLAVRIGIEVGNIFKLGTKYTVPLGARVLDESGKERPIIMGSYGIGPARIAAAAVEQRNDAKGIVWPKAIAPFDVHLIQVKPDDEQQTMVAQTLHDQLEADGLEVLWDEREERPGPKFADAELIGCPVRVTVGKRISEGIVEVVLRQGGTLQSVSIAECRSVVKELWEAAD